MSETMLEEWRSLHQILGPLDRHLQKSVANDCKEMRDKLKGKFTKAAIVYILIQRDVNTRQFPEIC